MRYLLPPGSGHFSTIWGLDRHEWGTIHFWISALFFLILAFHLVLHWRWLVSVVTGRPREGSGLRVGLGIVGLVAVVALAMAPLLTPVEKDVSSKGALSISTHRYEDLAISGAMTLKEVEETTAVPASYIINSLQLPETVSADARLGVLKKKYGFEINDVREIVKRYKSSE
jgi:hypothetical protein